MIDWVLMETFLTIDQSAFLFINNFSSNPLLGDLMLFFSKIGSGAVIWFALGLLLAFLEKKKTLKSAVVFLWPLLLAMVLSYLSADLILKPLIGRMRPNFTLFQAVLLGPIHYDFSFPSSHATTSFSAAFVLSKIKKRGKLFFYLLAVFISFSRIYIGVHYPSDVLAGMVLGVMIGKFSILIDAKLKNNY